MKAIVIGGGIIGLCSAYYLQQSGWSVTVIDKGDLSDNCSYGNLGMIVPSHFVPLAAPGMVSQGIRWMFNKRSPFYVKPSLNGDLVSWGLKFIKSATKERAEGAATSLLYLNSLSKELYEDLAESPGFDFGLEQKGILVYFKTQKVADEEVHLAHRAQGLGMDVATLNREEAQALEPEVKLDVLGAVHYRCDAHLYPNKLMAQMLEYLKAAGVTFITDAAVKTISVAGKKVKKVITDKGDYEADVVVLAAGSWLPALARTAGLRLPLMPGKGYSFMDSKPAHKLHVPAILCEARVAITPMNNGIRYGGTMEIGPINNRINPLRVEGIVRSVPQYFPDMKVEMPNESRTWAGFRPCTPDGLPYIGASKKVDNLLIAGGHAMMGLSLGPATGKWIADMAMGKEPDASLGLFHPDRFS